MNNPSTQNNNIERIGGFIYHYRYPLALVLLFLAVLSGTNGSSIAGWAEILKEPELLSDTLFGHPRLVRADEFATQSALLLSQFKGLQPLSYFSAQIGGRISDMFLVYGQPAWDIAEIFRPFHWGFLFLGIDYGMSFYWWGRLIFLFLSSFELAMLFTDGKKYFAVLLSFFIAFSPFVQWWYATNGCAEMLIYVNYGIVMVYRFLKEKRFGIRILYALAFVIPAGGFALTMYPAWMIPLFWIAVGFLIALIIRDRKEMKVLCPSFFLGIAAFLLLFGGGMLYVLTKSSDTVQLMLNSAYPGARKMNGGEPFFAPFLYTYVSNFFLQVKETYTVINSVEIAGFYSFYPLGLFLAVYVMIRRKKADHLLIAGLILDVVLSFYAIVGFPRFLSAVTLLMYSAAPRVFRIIGYLHLLVLFRAVSLMPELTWKELPKKGILLAGAAVICTSIAALAGWRFYQGDYYRWMFVISAAVLFGAMLLLMGTSIKPLRKWSVLLLSLFAVLTVILVNPIQKGMDIFDKSPTVSAVFSIKEEDPEGLWLVDNLNYPSSNIPLLTGASDFNATHVYPDLETWKQVDPEGQYEEIYNRYAHIQVKLTEEDTSFTLLQPDNFQVNLNVRELSKFNISYILTDRALEDLLPDCRCMKVLENGLRIYSVSYE